MSHREKNLTMKVGLLVVTSIIILMLGFIFLENITFRKRCQKIQASFNNISGLVVGADVQVHGVTRGKVESIIVKSEAVEVIFSLEENINLREDAYAALYQVSLITNEKLIDVFPGTSSTSYDTSGYMKTLPTYRFDAGQISGAISNVEGIITEISEDLDTTAGLLFTEGINLIIKTQSAVDTISSLLTELKYAVQETRYNMNLIGSELRYKSKRIEPTLDAIDSTLNKLDSALTLLIIIEDSIVHGKGTLGKLIMEDSLYYDIRRTLNSFEELAEDIKMNPRKYINLEIF